MAERATQMIDQRVMAEIAESLREEAADKPKAPKAKGRPKPLKPPLLGTGSIADEIAKLKALRDDGTLTEEQYALALDKALGGG
jgi:hypothetical protein